MGEVLVAGLGLMVAAACFFGFSIHRAIRRDAGAVESVRSRVKPRREPEQQVAAPAGLGGHDAPGAVAAALSSNSSSWAESVGDPDPLAEADVYLAYGRDLQAEEILREAMRDTPERLAIRTKLLEIYAKRRDVKGFEILAKQLHAATNGRGKDWARAQELGRAISPGNPLYERIEGSPTATVDPAPFFTDPYNTSLDFELPGFDEDSTSGTSSYEGADPLARKLELAEEFRQIGDTEGARDLLQDVIRTARRQLKELGETKRGASSASNPRQES